ncbi:cyanogenic beta-glucosidase-like [Cucurbita pepo subsp. pepo]|uniref:cyanogenic beta-glucosidase-like n=1 Tax=Cucurbita pepo subsp. pepo TaxID=3664 RepID=UPI000C9D8258|nr:cyanogenic beta-glucosidase-like [Cucurbita pepo subsp. pepo]
MAFKHGHSFLISVGLLLFLVAAKADVAPRRPIDVVRRSSFSKNFVFGSASAAYQFEGAAFEDSKGPSIWDNFTHQHPEKIYDHSNGDVALDQYHRYKEDVAILKKMGFNAYRFSIAWSRVLPKGKLSGGVNKKGIEYYNNLINELLRNGIQPFVTLFHWDTPQALEDEYGGFLGRQIVNDYRDYAELCFKEFGDRVKHWITLNEPWSFSMGGYAQGANAPGRCSSWQPYKCLGGDSGTEPYIVGHHQLLAHAAAVKVYKTKYQAYQKGVIGITLVTVWYTPNSNSEADKKAAIRALDFALGWYLHPITYGDYPPIMRELVKERLPKFSAAESASIKGSLDFLGLNYYTANYAKDNPNAPGQQPSYLTDYRADLSTDRNGVSIGPKFSEVSWLAVYPQGLKELLIYTKTKYNDPLIYITENGYLEIEGPTFEELINDKARVKYHHDHLYNLNEAIKAGVKVKGYFAWSFLDNFEWASGYAVRFGLNYIDYKNNLKRIPKLSAKWFENFLKT